MMATGVEPISLVLLPGLDGTGILFRRMLALLPSDLKPVVVRYPADRELKYEALFPLVMEVLPKDEPFILFGESFSGPLAIMAAATKPANLRGLILCASYVTPPLPALKWFVPFLSRGWFFRLFPRTLLMRLGARFRYRINMSGELTEVDSIVSPELIAFRIRDLFHVDARRALAECTVPIMYMAAGSDFVVPHWNLRTIQRIKPDMTVVTISGPHFIAQARPAEVVEAIGRFRAALIAGDGNLGLL
jgi:pimeloyl-ACP methyl ester carboxylesterase